MKVIDIVGLEGSGKSTLLKHWLILENNGHATDNSIMKLMLNVHDTISNTKDEAVVKMSKFKPMCSRDIGIKRMFDICQPRIESIFNDREISFRNTLDCYIPTLGMEMNHVFLWGEEVMVRCFGRKFIERARPKSHLLLIFENGFDMNQINGRPYFMIHNDQIEWSQNGKFISMNVKNKQHVEKLIECINQVKV
jgi:hypothetical protein